MTESSRQFASTLHGDSLSPDKADKSSTAIETLIAQLANLFAHRSAGSAAPTTAVRENNTSGKWAVEENLPSVEARYRVLVEQVPAVVFMAVVDGGISEVYVSPHIEQLLGFSREEWLDDPIRWYSQIHPDDRTRWSIEAAQLFLTGEPLKSVYRVISRDGGIVWFHCEAKLVRRQDGRLWFIHGVGFDVTGLKLAEQALQQQIAEVERLRRLELQRQIAKTEQTESRLAAIVESSQDAIIGKTVEGIVTSWNSGAMRMFGYRSAEIIGKSILLVVPPELHREESRILDRLKNGEEIENYDTERVTKSGQRMDVSVSVSPVKDGTGRVVGASKIARDITDRRRAEQQIRKLNAELQQRLAEQQAIMDVMPVGIAVAHDSSGTQITGNSALSELLQAKPEDNISLSGPEVSKLTFRAYSGGKELPPLDLPLQKAALTGKTVHSQELEIRHENGKVSHLLASANPLFDHAGKVQGAVAALVDISARRQMEEALRNSERHAAMGRLAATLAHEINNPLEAVTNTFYLLREHPSLDPEARELTRVAELELSRVNRIAKQTLGLYRQSEKPLVISLDRILEDVLEAYQRQIESSHIAVERKLMVDGRVSGFPVEVRQVFVNLIGNAIQAMAESNGRLRVHLFASRDRVGRKGVRVNIIDTGIGIRPEHREKLFQPFFTTKAEKGTGLGLWVSSGIVKKLEGSLRARSIIFRAKTVTCFSVFLPTQLTQQETKAIGLG
jgi:PAS domain S-box-containing protein